MILSVHQQFWPQKWNQKFYKTILNFLGEQIAARNLFQFDLDSHEFTYDTFM